MRTPEIDWRDGGPIFFINESVYAALDLPIASLSVAFSLPSHEILFLVSHYACQQFFNFFVQQILQL